MKNTNNEANTNPTTNPAEPKPTHGAGVINRPCADGTNLPIRAGAKRKPKPTHPGTKAKKLMRVRMLEGLRDASSPRSSITTPEEYDENIARPYGGAFACAPLIDGKPDARHVEVWRTSERVMRWCESVIRNAAALAASDLKGVDPEQARAARAEIMVCAREVRKLCATARRAMMLECPAVNALTEANAAMKEG